MASQGRASGQSKAKVSIKTDVTKKSSGGKKEHHGRPIFLPRPWRKHRHDILAHRARKHLNLDDADTRLEYSEADERVKTVPFGCLSFHILELAHVSVSVSAFEISAPLFYYGIVTLGRSKRVTKCVMSATPRKVRMDAVVILSCELSEWRENYRNRLKVEFWGFQDPEKHYIIGTSTLHMYNFVHHIHGIDSCFIWGDGVLRGKLIYEYAFSYGAFGYGHSTQFRNTDVPVLQAVTNSLFPRVRLEDSDVAEENFNTSLPARLKVMTYSSFVQEKARRKGAEIMVPKSMTLHQVEFEEGYPVHCKVYMPIYQHEIQADFNDAYGDYLCLPKRSERIEFCRKLLEGRRTDVREAEYASSLFQQLDEKEVEEILSRSGGGGDANDMNIGTERGCAYGHKTVVYPEDEKVFQCLPSSDRSSGYLGRLFGFGEVDAATSKRADFPLEELQFLKIEHQSKLSLRLWIKYVWSRFGACLTWLRHTILPVNTKNKIQIPEISVTLPSPQLSTTNLNVLWVEPAEPKGVMNEEQVFRQEAQRYGLPADDVNNDDGPSENFLRADQIAGQGDQGKSQAQVITSSGALDHKEKALIQQKKAQ